jgi:hypothetical protein
MELRDSVSHAPRRSYRRRNASLTRFQRLVLVTLLALVLLPGVLTRAGYLEAPQRQPGQPMTFKQWIDSGAPVGCLWAGPDNLCGTPDDGTVRWIWEAQR